jgi:hypothetical protein
MVEIRRPKKVQKFKLTEAELIAIETYSVQHYRYINPALAQNDDWLKGEAAQSPLKFSPNDPDEMEKVKKTGLSHARMAVSGSAKLPDWSGKVYRGQAEPENVVETKYKKGAVIPNSPFGSTSTNRSTSLGFATDLSISVRTWANVGAGESTIFSSLPSCLWWGKVEMWG